MQHTKSKFKICPRCRFQLSKTHQQKQICKRCGYTSNKLQVVRNQDAFQTKLKYTNKIHMKKIADPNAQTDNNPDLPLYLSAFQRIIKTIFRQFQKHFSASESLSYQQSQTVFKQIWFSYLMKMNQQKRPVEGVIKKLLHKQKKQQAKPTENQQNQDEVKEDEDEESASQKQDNENNLQKDQAVKKADQLLKKGQKQSLNDNVDKRQKKRNKSQFEQQSKKDESFFQKAKRIFMNSANNQNGSVLQQLLKAGKKYESFSSEILKYIAQKYALLELQVKLCRSGSKTVAEQINKLRHNKKYAKIKDLKRLLQLKNQNLQKSINKKYSLQLILLGYDLLRLWHQLTFQSKQVYPFQYIVFQYKAHPSRIQFIDAVLKQLQQHTQPQLIKKYEDSKKQFPQPSHAIICSLLYLTVLVLGRQIRLIQIVNFTANILKSQLFEDLTTQEKQLIGLLNQQNTKTRKVKKVSRQLISYLNLRINLNINKWALKYARIIQLEDNYTKVYTNLVHTLFKSFFVTLQNQSQQLCTLPLNQKRYIVLEQEQVVLSCLIIFFKLQFGLQRTQYPYLVNCACLNNLLSQQKIKKRFKKEDIQLLQVLQKFMNSNAKISDQSLPGQAYRHINLSIIPIIQNIIKKSESVSNIISYRDLNNKSAKELLIHFQYLSTKNQNRKITLTHFYKFSLHQQNQRKLKIHNINTKQNINKPQKNSLNQNKMACNLSLSQDFREQIKVIKESSIKNNFNINQENQEVSRQKLLDFPSSNYEFIYDGSIDIYQHLGFDNFLFVVQQVSFLLLGQHCNCKEIMEWLSHLEAILIQFQA